MTNDTLDLESLHKKVSTQSMTILHMDTLLQKLSNQVTEMQELLLKLNVNLSVKIAASTPAPSVPVVAEPEVTVKMTASQYLKLMAPPPPMHSMLSSEEKKLMATGQKIAAIKSLRTRYPGMQLIEAKNTVEQWQDLNPVEFLGLKNQLEAPVLKLTSEEMLVADTQGAQNAANLIHARTGILKDICLFKAQQWLASKPL